MSAPKQPTQDKVDEKAEVQRAVVPFYLPEYDVTVEAANKEEAVMKAKQLKEGK